MSSWRVFGRTPDTFRLSLEYGHPDAKEKEDGLQHVRLSPAGVVAALDFTWEDGEAEGTVVERFAQKLSGLRDTHAQECVHVTLTVQPAAQGGAPACVAVGVQHRLSYPALRCISVSRVGSSGTVSDSALKLLLQHCQVDGVWKMKGAEGFGNFWATSLDPLQLTSLRNLSLSYSGLSTLPGTVGQLSALKILRLSHNKLVTLPAELGQLTQLELLAVDSNLLTSVPVELRNCVSLRELNLEGNRIATPVLDLTPMRSTLQSLQLYGNPLEYLPELSPCSQLRSLSLANVRIMSDTTYSRWEVEVGPLAYMARSHKLTPLFKLTFRRASLQHPLLAGALGRIAEDKSQCELIAKEEVALQQLVLMALSDNHVVVRQACKVLGHLAACGIAVVNKLMSHDVARAVNTLVLSKVQDSQLCGLNLLSELASSSDSISTSLMNDTLLERLHDLICKGDPSVRQAALQGLSSLCYCAENRRAVRAAPGLLPLLAELAQAPSSRPNSLPLSRAGSRAVAVVGGSEPPHKRQRSEDATAGSTQNLGYASGSTRLSALRVLAVLGENDTVTTALNLPCITRRGVRVLALDGGGMKGITLVQLLRALQARLPKPLHTYWDLVVGTSTGAIVAVSMAVLRMPLDSVEAVYTELGKKVFNAARIAGSEESSVSWRDSLYRAYRSSSQTVRVAVYGSKHDPSAFEALLKEFADIRKHGCLSDSMIDTVSLGGIPKVALVSTLTSITPAQPYLFRTYELPPGTEAMEAHIAACTGSSRIPVWQAVRASASAPYYLDDFPLGEDRFQDGATTANNPALIALQQARLLWPQLHVETLVSLGCGCSAPARRERSVSSYLDTGSVLIESACSTDRVHEALATTLPLLPDTHYYRFQPTDDRFAVELDDVSPGSIAKLMAASSEYCVAHSARFDSLAELLIKSQALEGSDEEDMDDMIVNAAAGGSDAPPEDALDSGDVLSPRNPAPLKLGRKRGLLVLYAPRQDVHPVASGAHPCSHTLQAATVTALSKVPQLLRVTDLTVTCGSTNHPAPASVTAVTPAKGQKGNNQDSPFAGAAAMSHGRQHSFAFAPDSQAAQTAPATHPAVGATWHTGQKDTAPLPPASSASAQHNTTPAQGDAVPASEVVAPSGQVQTENSLGETAPLPSPSSQSTNLTSSIFNYFLPRWSVSSGAADPTTATTPTASPTPAAGSLASPNSTKPAVQVLPMTSSAGGGQPASPATTQQTKTVFSLTATIQPTSMRFPVLAVSGPNSPVTSPMAARAMAASNAFSPAHDALSPASASAPNQAGQYLFRSRSKTESGPLASAGPPAASTATAPLPAPYPPPPPPIALPPPPANAQALQTSPQQPPLPPLADSPRAATPASPSSQVQPSVQGPEEGVQGSEACPKARAVIQGLLEDLGQEGLGVVHLALEADGGGGHGEGTGLITQWTHEVVSIMEPSSQATHLVHQLGGSAHQSIQDVTHGAVVFRIGLAQYTRLGLQEVLGPGGQLVRSWLFSVSHPVQQLTPLDVTSATLDWAALLITASCVVPRPLVEAFLRAGVRALVCLAHEPCTQEQQAALPAVFQRLLEKCVAGTPFFEALAVAEEEADGVCRDLLVCHHT